MVAAIGTTAFGLSTMPFDFERFKNRTRAIANARSLMIGSEARLKFFQNRFQLKRCLGFDIPLNLIVTDEMGIIFLITHF